MTADEPPVETPAPQRTWLLVFGVIAAGVCAFFVVRILIALTSDFLPAKYIDVDRSAYVRMDASRAKLTLTLRFSPSADSVRLSKVPREGDTPLTVKVYAAGTRPDVRGNDLSVTLEMELPAEERVRVLDLRWDHVREHPQGHEFVLEDGSGP